VVSLTLYGGEPTQAAANEEHPERVLLLLKDESFDGEELTNTRHRLLTYDVDALSFSPPAQASPGDDQDGDPTNGGTQQQESSCGVATSLDSWFASVKLQGGSGGGGEDDGNSTDGGGSADSGDDGEGLVRWRALTMPMHGGSSNGNGSGNNESTDGGDGSGEKEGRSFGVVEGNGCRGIACVLCPGMLTLFDVEEEEEAEEDDDDDEIENDVDVDDDIGNEEEKEDQPVEMEDEDQEWCSVHEEKEEFEVRETKEDDDDSL